MTLQCTNLANDRSIGATWERNFCRLATGYGFMFTPMQIGRTSSALAYVGKQYHPLTLPDVTIWSFPGQHHEIKHKNPTHDGLFGLEEYRLKALLAFAGETRQSVHYTIHNHDLSGGRESELNDINHWFTVDVLDLEGKQYRMRNDPSWVNGTRKIVPILYWRTALWIPLSEYWESVMLAEPAEVARVG